jgi:SAM-dependent methyltransferase
MAREDAHVEVAEFDGETLPYDDGSFDGVLFADVLHHSAEPRVLLREARRVARSFVVIKDHLKDGFLAGPTLRFMDRVGNERHGVALPYNYWRRAEWDAAFAEVGLAPVEWIADLRLYPRPADWIFGRGLHFITRLECAPGAAHSPRGSAGCRGSR